MYMVGSTDNRLHAMTVRQNRVLLLWTAKIAHVRNGYETQCIIVSSAMPSNIQDWKTNTIIYIELSHL